MKIACNKKIVIHLLYNVHKLVDGLKNGKKSHTFIFENCKEPALIGQFPSKSNAIGFALTFHPDYWTGEHLNDSIEVLSRKLRTCCNEHEFVSTNTAPNHV